MSRRELVALVHSLTDQLDGVGSCAGGAGVAECMQSGDSTEPKKYTAAHVEGVIRGRLTRFHANDGFTEYDQVYPGLWRATPNGTADLEGLNELALPSPKKKAQAIADERTRLDLLQKEKDGLSADGAAARKQGYKLNNFNQFASDGLSLHRRVHDTRPPGCLRQLYPALRHMPSTSVIVVFYNEARSTLLRTAWSIVDRTPPELLEEVILVDDGSTMSHLFPSALDAEVAQIPRTRVLRLPERVGLIRAKVRGVEAAAGDVVAFMDSHCEVNDGWLEPLLAEIVRNPRAVAIPLIDPIHYDTFSIGQAIAEIGIFSWTLEFGWLPAIKGVKEPQLVEPFQCPIMCGGIFAMGREFFMQAGTYDENMDTWGGENFEMSFRLWMCGGELVTVPCSRIAHVFRKRSPYTFKDRNPMTTIAHNLNRVASVWMDQYTEVYQMFGDRVKVSPNFGDVSDRVALRDRLKCKSFDWYMKEVGSIHSMFVPDPANYVSAGLLRNEHTQQCVYHEGNPLGDRLLVVMRECAGHFDAQNEGPEALFWYHTGGDAPHPGELRHESGYGSRCVMAHEVAKNARVSLVRCYDHETAAKALQWRHNNETKQLSLVNFPTGCLTASPTHPDQVIVSKCKPGKRQQWTFVPWKHPKPTTLQLT